MKKRLKNKNVFYLVECPLLGAIRYVIKKKLLTVVLNKISKRLGI